MISDLVNARNGITVQSQKAKGYSQAKLTLFVVGYEFKERSLQGESVVIEYCYIQWIQRAISISILQWVRCSPKFIFHLEMDRQFLTRLFIYIINIMITQYELIKKMNSEGYSPIGIYLVPDQYICAGFVEAPVAHLKPGILSV